MVTGGLLEALGRRRDDGLATRPPLLADQSMVRSDAAVKAAGPDKEPNTAELPVASLVAMDSRSEGSKE
ncbi:hypothetical protein MUK42_21342 [Musa troglodytarum]|uniref:Uncharacterized protein n=1 Tax=Musa troglodytarum TaxID=320322 RepID=A0A9E7JH96_9LILI|nr:hypothetical protein MUK42_21342 [Musa troglodytarum]